MLRPAGRYAEYGELAGLFFLQAMATGMWMVPLTRILDSHGYGGLSPFAFATSSVAAFVSPLIFGAMADRHFPPVVVLRGLACTSGIAMALTGLAVSRAWPTSTVLMLAQLYALCSAPTGSIASAIVFSRLHDSQRQFGPIRATATFGWMCGCWLISAFSADASPWAWYAGAIVWAVVAGFTFVLPRVPPPPSSGKVTLAQRMGWDALVLLKNHDHRVVFLSAALFSIPLAAFYPFTPQQLRELGFERTSAWMSLGQVTEVVAMLSLAGLFARWRLKWIFGMGLGVGVLRYILCSMNGKGWVLAGVTLHGLSFTLFFITAQIYLNERVDPAWRVRAQALMTLMNLGVGYLVGYIGGGFWLKVCQGPHGTLWNQFWLGLAAAMAGVLVFFYLSYHGQKGLRASAPR